MRPMVFVDADKVAAAIDMGWMFVGYGFGILSGMIGLGIVGGMKRWL